MKRLALLLLLLSSPGMAQTGIDSQNPPPKTRLTPAEQEFSASVTLCQKNRATRTVDQNPPSEFKKGWEFCDEVVKKWIFSSGGIREKIEQDKEAAQQARAAAFANKLKDPNFAAQFKEATPK